MTNVALVGKMSRAVTPVAATLLRLVTVIEKTVDGAGGLSCDVAGDGDVGGRDDAVEVEDGAAEALAVACPDVPWEVLPARVELVTKCVPP